MNKKWIGRLTCLLLATLVLYILTVYVLVPNCYTAFGDYELGPGDTQASWGGYFGRPHEAAVQPGGLSAHQLPG